MMHGQNFAKGIISEWKYRTPGNKEDKVMLCNFKENKTVEIIFDEEEFERAKKYHDLLNYLVNRTADPDKLEAMWNVLNDAGLCD